LREIFARWPQVALSDGTLNREALAAIIFARPTEREAVNAIVHPAVRRGMREREREARPDQMVMYEVPLLFENGLYKEMDENVLVTAPPEQRIARLIARNGWTREQILARMAALIAPEEAEKKATHILRNDGSLEQLRRKAEKLARELSGERNRL
jgi:dephospho-CoA kinase